MVKAKGKESNPVTNRTGLKKMISKSTTVLIRHDIICRFKSKIALKSFKKNGLERKGKRDKQRERERDTCH